MDRMGILNLAFSSRAKLIVLPAMGTDSDAKSPDSLQEVGTNWEALFLAGVGIYLLLVVTKVTWKHNAAFFLDPIAHFGGPL